MKLLHMTAEQQHIVKMFLECHQCSPKIRLGIHEADQMYAHSLADSATTPALISYFTTGLRIFSSVKQILDWHFGSCALVTSFLDFACGYGRFTRFLLTELAPERIWSSDIYADAVSFQREYFGVNGVLSVPAPEDFRPDRKFDCIHASSFFTHAPDSTFNEWLTTLYGLLNPEGGVLIFSVMDIALAQEKLPTPDASFLHIPGSYDPGLSAREFGCTYVSAVHIQRVLERVKSGNPAIHRIPVGLDFLLDIYVVTNRADRWKRKLNFAYPPRADHGAWTTDTGFLSIQGWASDHYNVDGYIEDIRLVVNGKVAQHCILDIELPHVAKRINSPSPLLGWSFTVTPDQRTPEDILLVDVINSRGSHTVMYCVPVPGAS